MHRTSSSRRFRMKRALAFVAPGLLRLARNDGERTAETSPRHCEFSTGLRPTRVNETGAPQRNLMVRSRALARRLEPWAARPSFETRAQESALLRMRALLAKRPTMPHVLVRIGA